MNNFLIECLDVSKEYYQGNKTIKVLENIKFNLQRGSSIGILGPSGSGKTTLLHILAGIDVPTSGEVLFKGQQFSNCDTNAKAYLRNQNIGFVYQFHHLLPEFSALENVFLPAFRNASLNFTLTLRNYALTSTTYTTITTFTTSSCTHSSNFIISL